MIPTSRILRQFVPLVQNASYSMSSGVQSVKLPKQHEWNRAVSSAEKLVGFPTSLFHLRALMSDDVTSMTEHVRKLMGSDHPVLRALKRLIIQGGQNNVQVRGLMMLLLARALNPSSEFAMASDELDESSGVLIKQRKLAEILEMISAAQSIHKTVLNLPHEIPNNADADTKDDLQQLEYGNKIAILGGDYLLANACVGLADLRNTYIVEMMAIAIGEFTQSEFLGKRDVQGRLVPDQESIQLKAWLHRNKMASGSLLASGFKGSAMLSNHSDTVTETAEKLGRNTALALQAFTELQPFVDENHHDQVLDLSSAPILFQLQNDAELMAYIQGCDGDIENLDLKQVYSTVVNSGYGIQMTQELCRTHAMEALKDMVDIPDGDAKSALERLINYLKH